MERTLMIDIHSEREAYEEQHFPSIALIESQNKNAGAMTEMKSRDDHLNLLRSFKMRNPIRQNVVKSSWTRNE